MPHMTKFVWTKLTSPFSSSGRLRMNGESKSFREKLNVNEEYKEVFRTKSYVEMWSTVNRRYLEKTCPDGSIDDRLNSSSLSSSSPDLSFCLHFSDYLSQKQQAITEEMLERFNSHGMLMGYFKASLEACDVCDLLLRCIHQTRANFRRIKRVIKLSKKVLDSDAEDFSDEEYAVIFKELAAYALMKNPLSYVTPAQFRNIHDNNLLLLQRLYSEQRKMRRRAKLNRLCKKVVGYGLVFSHTVLIVALVVIAVHGLAGIVAAPGLVYCSVCLFREKIKSIRGRYLRTGLLEKQCSELDLAAKGTYILINDFDTTSRIVRRLYDEIEHRKALADMCVRKKKAEMLKQVVREIYLHDAWYMEQLEELEEHIYLCFHTINRFRRLLLQEVMAGPKTNNSADDHVPL